VTAISLACWIVRTGPRRRLPLLGVGVGVALVLGPLPGCADTAGESPRAAPAALRSLRLPLVDTARPTPAHGRTPALAHRSLPTLVTYPTGARRPLPLLVFAHGFHAAPEDYSVIIRPLAAGGYVVAAPAFPVSNRAAPGGPAVSDYVNQPADVSFVISRLMSSARDRRSPLHGRIDPTRVAVIGHSLGAVTVLGLALNRCCADPRVKAVIAMSGAGGDEVRFGAWGASLSARHPPLLLVHGTADRVVPYACSRHLFHVVRPRVALLTMLGAPHNFFGSGAGSSWHATLIRVGLDYLRATLDHDTTARARLRRDAPAGVAQLAVRDRPGPVRVRDARCTLRP
jgi:dienelactone hydrolase